MYQNMTPYEAFFEHLKLRCDEFEHVDDFPGVKADTIRRFRQHEVGIGQTSWVNNTDPWGQADEAAEFAYERGPKPQWMIDLEGNRD